MHFVIKASNLAHIYIILVYENLDIVPSPISRLGAWQLFSYVIPHISEAMGSRNFFKCLDTGNG